jgi:uncharacterized protein YbdZ (MbtH family)
MRAELNRGQLLNKFKLAEKLIDEAKSEAIKGAADHLVKVSPVDTGTYIDNHNIGVGNSTPVSSSTSSEGKTGYYAIEGLAYNPIAPRVEREEARQKLWSQIIALPEGWKRASLSNSAVHFNEVEYGWTPSPGSRVKEPVSGYGVYASLRAAWPTIKADAVARAEAKFKI